MAITYTEICNEVILILKLFLSNLMGFVTLAIFLWECIITKSLQGKVEIWWSIYKFINHKFKQALVIINSKFQDKLSQR